MQEKWIGVSERLKEFLAQHSISMRKMSALVEELSDTKVSAASLSLLSRKQMNNGSVWGDDLLFAVSHAMQRYEEDAARPLETKNLKMITTICEECIGKKSMHVVIGESGFGKTTAFREYLRRNKEAVAITADPTMKLRSMLQAICEAVDIDYRMRATPHKIVLDLIERAPDQIIIDDAHRLTSMCFETLRKIHDASEKTSIIILGQSCLINKLTVSSNKEENLTQLVSRIGLFVELQAPDDAEIRGIINKMGIAKRDVQDAIVKNCRVLGHKNLHRVERLVNAIKEMAETNNTPLNEVPDFWADEARKDML